MSLISSAACAVVFGWGRKGEEPCTDTFNCPVTLHVGPAHPRSAARWGRRRNAGLPGRSEFITHRICVRTPAESHRGIRAIDLSCSPWI
jgi:hypothetical protein